MSALDTHLAHRRRGLLAVAAVLAVHLLLDLLLDRGTRVLALRALWLLVVLGGWAVQRPARPRLADGALLGGAPLVTLLAVLIVAQVGHPGPRFALLVAVPISVFVLAPELPWAGALALGVGVVGGGAVLRLEGGAWSAVADWVAMATVTGVLVLWGALNIRRLWAGELARERERARLAEELTESERRRADAERLAQVGRLASAAAHDINNPLAVVKASATWLEERVAAKDAEVQEVLGDVRIGLDRIAAAVDGLRRAGAGGRDGPVPGRAPPGPPGPPRPGPGAHG